METVIIITVGIVGAGITGRQLYKIIKEKSTCEYCSGSCKNFYDHNNPFPGKKRIIDEK